MCRTKEAYVPHNTASPGPYICKWIPFVFHWRRNVIRNFFARLDLIIQPWRAVDRGLKKGGKNSARGAEFEPQCSFSSEKGPMEKRRPATTSPPPSLTNVLYHPRTRSVRIALSRTLGVSLKNSSEFFFMSTPCSLQFFVNFPSSPVRNIMWISNLNQVDGPTKALKPVSSPFNFPEPLIIGHSRLIGSFRKSL